MTEEQYSQVEKYFRRELSEAELEVFKKDLEQDREFHKEFNLHRLTAAALQHQEVDAFKQQHASTATERRGGAKVRSFRWTRWVAAASILLLLGFFAWRMNQSATEAARMFTKYDLADLYPKPDYALVDEGLLHKGVIDSNDFAALKLKGLRAFDASNWDDAIRFLSAYLQQAQPSPEETADEINLMNLYIGRAWLEKSDLPKAIASLQAADEGISDPANYGLLQELIRWQLLLAHLKNEDYTRARSLAESLGTAQHLLIRQQSTELLNDLK